MATSLRDLIPDYDPEQNLTSLIPGTAPAAPGMNFGPATQARNDELEAADMGQLRRGWNSTRLGTDANSLRSQQSSLRADGDLAAAQALEPRIGAIQERAGVFAPAEQEFTNLSLREPGRALDWGLGAVGSAAASMLDPIAIGAAANTAGNAVSMIPHPLARGAGMALRGAGLLGAYGYNANQQKGGFYDAALQDPEIMRAKSAQEINTMGNVYGGVSAVPDSFIPGLVAKRIAPVFGRKALAEAGQDAAGGMAGKVFKDQLGEAATEGGQQFGQQLALGALNPNRDTSGDLNDIINAAAVGGVGTGPISAASHLAARAKARPGVVDDPNDDVSGQGTQAPPKSLDESLVRDAKAARERAPVSAEAESWRATLMGQGEGDFVDLETRSHAALLKELGGRVEKGEAAAQPLLDALASQDQNDPTFILDNDGAREAARKYLQGNGVSEENDAALEAAYKGRKLNQISATDLGGTVLKDGRPDNAGPLMSDLDVKERRDITERRKLTTDVLLSEIGEGRRARLTKAVRGMAEDLAELSSRALNTAKGTVGQQQRILRLGQQLVNLVGSDRAADVLDNVGRTANIEGSPLFKTMSASVRVARDDLGGYERSLKVSREDAAAQLVKVVPPAAERRLRKAGLDLNDPVDREVLLAKVQQFFANEADRPKAEFVATFGKDGLEAMREIANQRIVAAPEPDILGDDVNAPETKTPAVSDGPERDDGLSDDLSDENESDNWALEGAKKNIDRAPGSKEYTFKSGRTAEGTGDAGHPFMPNKHGNLPLLTRLDDTNYNPEKPDEDGPSTIEDLVAQVYERLGAGPEHAKSETTSLKPMDGGPRIQGMPELMAQRTVREDYTPEGWGMGSTRVRVRSARQVMDDKKVPGIAPVTKVSAGGDAKKTERVRSGDRVSMLEHYLRRPGKKKGKTVPPALDEMDQTIQTLRQLDQAARAMIAEGVPKKDRTTGAVIPGSGAPQLDQLNAERDALTQQLAEKAGVEYKAGMTLVGVANAYFDERHVVVTEHMAEKDQLRIDKAEPKQWIRRGNDDLDFTDQFGEDATAKQAEMNLIRFKSKAAVAKDGIAVVRASDLVKWVFDNRNDYKKKDYRTPADQAREFRDALMEGIGALLVDHIERPNAPFMLNAAGEVESFKDGFPPSLILSTMTQADLNAKKAKMLRGIERVPKTELAKAQAKAKALKDSKAEAHVDKRAQQETSATDIDFADQEAEARKLEETRTEDREELLDEGRESAAPPVTDVALEDQPGLFDELFEGPPERTEPARADATRYWARPAAEATDAVRQRAMADKGTGVKRVRVPKFATAPETLDKSDPDTGRTPLDLERDQKKGVPTDRTDVAMRTATKDAALAPIVVLTAANAGRHAERMADAIRAAIVLRRDARGAFQHLQRLVNALERDGYAKRLPRTKVSSTGTKTVVGAGRHVPGEDQLVGGKFYAAPLAHLLTPKNIEQMVKHSTNAAKARASFELFASQTAAAIAEAKSSEISTADRVKYARLLSGDASLRGASPVTSFLEKKAELSIAHKASAALEAQVERKAKQEKIAAVEAKRNPPSPQKDMFESQKVVPKNEPTLSGRGRITPTFDALPAHQPGQRTMVYAGIGSRETPPEVLAKMRASARRLAALGYTLSSGGAAGADTAFEAGAGAAKTIYKASAATDKTRQIAREIHPNPGALSAFPLNLMARNTNQIFGAKLDAPVDFVLTWTPDGAESTAQRSIKTGGTGQAIDMASRKGIPVINMAVPGWEQRVKAIVEAEKASEQAAAKTLNVAADIAEQMGAPSSVRDMPMNYRDGTDGMRMRPSLAGKSTMDLIREGVRTATTGALGRFKGLKLGDVFTVVGADDERIQVRVTQMPVKVSSLTPSEWAQPEGWMSVNHAKYKDAYQMRYELVGPVNRKLNEMTGPLLAPVSTALADTRDIMRLLGFKTAPPQFANLAEKLLTDPAKDAAKFMKESAEALSHALMGGERGEKIRAFLKDNEERRRIVAQLMRGGMGGKDAYASSYRVMTERVLAGELTTETAGTGVVGLITKMAKALMVAFRQMTGSPEFADLVRQQLNDLVASAHKPAELKRGFKKVTFQEAVDADPAAAAVLTHMAAYPGTVLTGSIVLATGGPIYRNAAHMLHDLDFIITTTRAEAEAYLRTVFPGATQMADFKTSNGKVDSYIVPPPGAAVTNVKRQFGDKGKLTSYTIERDGQVIGRKWTTDAGEQKQGESGTIIDFFTETGEDASSVVPFTVGGKSHSVKVAPIGHIFNAKLKIGRDKDITDYLLYKPEAGRKLNEATSAETFQSAETAPKDDQVAKAFAYIKKVLGPKVQVQFLKDFDATGEWIEASNLIKLALNTGPGVLTTAHHEAMHALWSQLIKNHPAAAKALAGAMSSPETKARLEALLHKEPAALKAITTGPNAAEERVAYAYQFWAAGLLEVDKPAATFFAKVRKFLRKVFGMVRETETALDIMTAFHAGQLAEPSAAGRVIGKIMADATWNRDQRVKWDKQIAWLHAGIAPSNSVLRKMESATAQALGMTFFSNPGEAKAGSLKEGYLNARARKVRQYTNYLYDIVKELSPKDMEDAAQHLQLKTPLADIPYAPTREAVKGIRALTARYYEYATKDAGLQLKMLAADHYPRVWSLERLVKDKDKFVAMILKPEYAKVMASAVAVTNANRDPADHVTADDVAARLHEELMRKNGVDEVGLDTDNAEPKHGDIILSPFFASQKERSFGWLKDEDVEPYLEKDLVGAMSRYLHQGIRSAEFARRFGNGGVKLKELVAQKGDIELDEATGKRLPRPTDGPIAKELRESAADLGLKDKELEDWVARRMEDVRNSVAAHEGSLGSDISPTWRKWSSAAMAYQNLRLLPLSLFAAFGDTMGLMAHGAGGKATLEAFVQGLKDVYARWKQEFGGLDPKRTRSVWEGIAEMVGAVDSHMFLEQIGKAHTSEFMTDFARKSNRWLFMANGLTAWDRSMRVSATKAAVLFLQDHAGLPDKVHSARWLAELGLEPSAIPLDKDGNLITNRHVLAASRMTEGMTDEQKAEALAQATADIERVHHGIVRWVEGAVLTPNAAQRPTWASDPHWAVLFHLKQFTYSFHDTILRRSLHETGNGNMTPIAALAAAVPVMMASGIVKGLVQGGGDFPQYMQGMGLGDHMVMGAEKAGLAGIYQFGIDALNDPAGLLGPTVDQALTTVLNPEDVGKNLHNAVPGLRYIKDAPDFMRVA